MNCRFTPTAERSSNFSRALVTVGLMTRVVRVALRTDQRVALHHRPGEGSGETS